MRGELGEIIRVLDPALRDSILEEGLVR